MCVCRAVHGAGGQGGLCGCLEGLGDHMPAVQGQSVRGEGTHGKHESLWGGCSTNAGDTYGRHVSVEVSTPFCVQRAVPGGRREQPGAAWHCGDLLEPRLSQASVWLRRGRPWMSEGPAHPWDNKG